MREYQEKDYQELCSWFSQRDMPSPPAWSIPPTGFFVENVAAGFLIMCSNGCAVLDFYISNPHSQLGERKIAFEMITDELIAAAKEVGVRILLCNTQTESIKRLALKVGFKSDGYFESFNMEL